MLSGLVPRESLFASCDVSPLALTFIGTVGDVACAIWMMDDSFPQPVASLFFSTCMAMTVTNDNDYTIQMSTTYPTAALLTHTYIHTQ